MSAAAELMTLAPGVSAWIQTPFGAGRPNAGVIVDTDGITLVDTLATPGQAHGLALTLEGFNIPIRRVALTSSHIEYVGGTQHFWAAAFYGRSQTSDHLDQPVNPAILRQLLPDLANEYTDEFTTRPVTHTVDEPAWLTPAAHVVPLGGEMAENLVVHVPGAGVVFAGALASFGVTPLVFDGDPEAWADALEEIIGLGDTIVPGHGAPGGESEARALQAYLWACVEANGDAGAIPAGPWDDWAERDRDSINCERAAMLARGDTSPPPSMLSRLGLA
jgi:glyoxylase-like metal-dependent hydrolase (beta-lactamase superfamily II)